MRTNDEPAVKKQKGFHCTPRDLGKNDYWRYLVKLHDPKSDKESTKPTREERVELVLNKLLTEPPTITVKQLPFNQFTVGCEQRFHQRSSACCRLAGRCATDFACGIFSNEKLDNNEAMRGRFLDAVRSPDQKAHAVTGEYVHEYVLSQKVPGLITATNSVVSRRELALELCSHRPPHSICITAPIPSTSKEYQLLAIQL